MVKRQLLESTVQPSIRLSTLPDGPARVRAVLDNEEASFDRIGSTVGYDPVLTIRLLVAASARFGDEVPRLGAAARVVGLDRLRAMVDETPIMVAEEQGWGHQALWTHLRATAIAARELAKKTSLDPELCYVAGLVHDIGKAVLLEHFPADAESMRQAARQQQLTYYGAELESGDPSHAQIGRRLALALGLPPVLVEAIAYHHTPRSAKTFTVLVSVVAAADMLARALALGDGGDPYIPPLSAFARSEIGIAPADIAVLFDAIGRQMDQTENAYHASIARRGSR